MCLVASDEESILPRNMYAKCSAADFRRWHIFYGNPYEEKQPWLNEQIEESNDLRIETLPL